MEKRIGTVTVLVKDRAAAPQVNTVISQYADIVLPITTNCYPYYHWKDVKRYYLRKLYAYARERNEE